MESTTFLCALQYNNVLFKPTGLSNAYKIGEGLFVHYVVTKEEITCSICSFIALCSYQTMVIYSS